MAQPSYDTSHGWQKAGGLQCHACDVICERVVHPSHCLRSSCRYVYAYEEWGVTYFGCVQKIFGAELDLAPYRLTPRRDVYGAFVARRTPLPHCQVEIEKAYGSRYSWQGCRNPIFRQNPADYAPEAIRQLVDGVCDPGD